MNIVKCEGIEIHGTVFHKTSTRQDFQIDALLETQHFIFYEDLSAGYSSFVQVLTIALEIILQNTPNFLRELSICEITENVSTSSLHELVVEILSKKPLVMEHCVTKNINDIREKYDLLLIDYANVSGNIEVADFLTENAFVIVKCSTSLPHDNILQLEKIFSPVTNCGKLFLFRKPCQILKKTCKINISNTNFDWINKLQAIINGKHCEVLTLVCQNNGISGILGLLNCLNKEPIRCEFKIIITDGPQSEDTELYKNQMKKNLVTNILKDKKWGTYVKMPLELIRKIPVTNASIEIPYVGDLSSLNWFQSPPIYFE